MRKFLKPVFRLFVNSMKYKELSTEIVAQRCSVKEVFLEHLQNSQENTCARVSLLIKLQVYFCYRTPLVAASLSASRPAANPFKFIMHRSVSNKLTKQFLENKAYKIFTNLLLLWWNQIHLSELPMYTYRKYTNFDKGKFIYEIYFNLIYKSKIPRINSRSFHKHVWDYFWKTPSVKKEIS